MSSLLQKATDAVTNAVHSVTGAGPSNLPTDPSQASSPPSLNLHDSKMVDPLKAYPGPPFKPNQEQDWPGSEAQMEPRPDYGQTSYRGSGKLTDQVALITGGDSGIGRAVAIAFAREGADVAISYYDEHEDAKETEKWVVAAGRRCLLLPGDLKAEAQCKAIVDLTVQQFGRIDLLILNHAYQGKIVKSIAEIDRNRVENAFLVNIVSFFTITAQAVPHMKKGASIITTGSIEAYQPEAQILDYAVTKAAIVGFTKGLAQELLPKGIRVNSVAPGPVWTPLIVVSFDKKGLATFGGDYGPIARPAQPVELAPSYVFLASQESKYISAEILAVTGGMPTA